MRDGPTEVADLHRKANIYRDLAHHWRTVREDKIALRCDNRAERLDRQADLLALGDRTQKIAARGGA